MHHENKFGCLHFRRTHLTSSKHLLASMDQISMGFPGTTHWLSWARRHGRCPNPFPMHREILFPCLLVKCSTGCPLLSEREKEIPILIWHSCCTVILWLWTIGVFIFAFLLIWHYRKFRMIKVISIIPFQPKKYRNNNKAFWMWLQIKL